MTDLFSFSGVDVPAPEENKTRASSPAPSNAQQSSAQTSRRTATPTIAFKVTVGVVRTEEGWRVYAAVPGLSQPPLDGVPIGDLGEWLSEITRSLEAQQPLVPISASVATDDEGGH